MINVFISHNFKDKPLARKIAMELSKYGVKPWIDEAEIKLGDSLIEKINDGLDNMDFLIALISGNSVKSNWVETELKIAMNSEIEKGKVITIPILAGKCDLPGFLKGKLYCDMSTPRKYNENKVKLIRRFDISEIQDDNNEFTDYKLSAVQVIEKIEKCQNDELIEFLESFGYSERNLFYRDTFIQTVNQLLEDEKISQDVVVSIINICRYCPNEIIFKINLSKLLSSKQDDVLQALIKVLANTKSLKIHQRKILQILKNCNNEELQKIIWDYFLIAQLDIDIAKDLWNFIQENFQNKYDNKVVMCMCKLHNQLNDDTIFELWYALWNKASDKEKTNLLGILCQYGFESEGVFLTSPKLRNNIKNILFDGFGDNDTHNANLMIALLTSAGNLVESRNEVWNKLFDLDEYSILLTLELLRDDYNIAYIFDSVEDVNALKEFMSSENMEIKNAALGVIAEINNREALEIISEAEDFLPQYFNSSSLLYTIIKETDVVECKELFLKVKEKITNGYLDKIEKNLILIGDYLLGSVDLDILLDGIEIDIEKTRNFNTFRNVKLLTEKLRALIEKGNNKQQKKINEIILEYKKEYANI